MYSKSDFFFCFLEPAGPKIRKWMMGRTKPTHILLKFGIRLSFGMHHRRVKGHNATQKILKHHIYDLCVSGLFMVVTMSLQSDTQFPKCIAINKGCDKCLGVVWCFFIYVGSIGCHCCFRYVGLHIGNIYFINKASRLTLFVFVLSVRVFFHCWLFLFG